MMQGGGNKTLILILHKVWQSYFLNDNCRGCYFLWLFASNKKPISHLIELFCYIRGQYINISIVLSHLVGK